MRDNSIGRWSAAWGPRPEKVKDRTAPFTKPKNCWRWVKCETCDSVPVAVYGPKTEVYECARCLLPMTLTLKKPR
jgi:hypothetical protein